MRCAKAEIRQHLLKRQSRRFRGADQVVFAFYQKRLTRIQCHSLLIGVRIALHSHGNLPQRLWSVPTGQPHSRRDRAGHLVEIS